MFSVEKEVNFVDIYDRETGLFSVTVWVHNRITVHVSFNSDIVFRSIHVTLGIKRKNYSVYSNTTLLKITFNMR